jgi:hypothetical protein
VPLVLGIALTTDTSQITVLLGSAESLFAGLDLPALGFRCTEHVPTQDATHVVLRKD